MSVHLVQTLIPSESEAQTLSGLCCVTVQRVSIERATERKRDVTEERQFGNSFKRATEYCLLERATN